MSKQVKDRGIKSPEVRQAAYIVLGAALAVLTVFDVITEDVAQQIESIALQILGVFGFSLAAVNKPQPDDTELAPPGTEQGM